jgi:hypothetical protein
MRGLAPRTNPLIPAINANSRSPTTALGILNYAQQEKLAYFMYFQSNSVHSVYFVNRIEARFEALRVPAFTAWKWETYITHFRTLDALAQHIHDHQLILRNRIWSR